MSVVALVDPATLLGQGVRHAFSSTQPEHEFRLLATAAEAEGTLTQIGNEVALVHTLTRESLAAVDLAILCGSGPQQRVALDLAPADTPIISFDAGGDSPEGIIAIAGITESATLDGSVLVSPHAGVVALCHLLAPLVSSRPSQVVATILQPTSVHNEPGFEELFAQTRNILNFQGELPTEVFPGQLAFNLLPTAPPRPIGRQTAEALGIDTEISARVLQAPVFHSLALSVYVEFASPIPAEQVRDALENSDYLTVVSSVDTLGPIDAAAREEILVGRIEAAEGLPGAFWIWAVMDNLTRGGASNAVELARTLLMQSA